MRSHLVHTTGDWPPSTLMTVPVMNDPYQNLVLAAFARHHLGQRHARRGETSARALAR